MLMDLQERENIDLPLYEQQLRDVERNIENLLNAIRFPGNICPPSGWLLAIQALIFRTFLLIFQKQVHFRSTKFYLLLTRPVKSQTHEIIRVSTSLHLFL